MPAHESELVRIPFASTAEIAAWAKQLVGDSRDDIEKARRLFEGLTRHINLSQEIGGRTAAEAFRDWSDPKAGITCQDYTFLYVAMARAVGLKAYYVLVDKDYRNKVVFHACAGIFVNEKALLIDPGYRWFGAPHKEYQFEDDLRVVAAHLAQSSDVKKENLCLKLAPKWALPHFWIVASRIYHGQLDQARALLQVGLRLDSKSEWALYAQVLLEVADRHWEAAVMHSRDCLSLDPDAFIMHYFLGIALESQGKLTDARDEYRAYLEGETQPEFAARAREAIARLNEIVPELRL